MPVSLTADRHYIMIISAVVWVLAAIMAITYAVALGHPLAIVPWVDGLIGALFMVIGNYLGKISKNFFVGIRAPWALADDEVWLRTHRLGGRLCVGAGAWLILISLLGLPPVIGLAGIAAAILIPLVYSYMIYRKRAA